jgi:hypothetical protein
MTELLLMSTTKSECECGDNRARYRNRATEITNNIIAGSALSIRGNGDAGMADRIAEFLQQAKLARERAAGAEGEFRGQWLRVAEMWELLAKEYSRARNLPPREGRTP